jgi:hypothetical protein
VSLGKIIGPEEIIEKIKSRITDIISLLEGEKDCRKGLAEIYSVRQAFRGLSELYENKENTFASWLVWMFNTELYRDYGAKKDEYYILNKANVESMTKEYKNYLECLKKAVAERSVDQIAEATSKVVFALDNLARSRIDTET